MSRTRRPPIEPPFGVVRVEMAPKVALVFTAPIHIIPETNQREHWGTKAKRVKKHRADAKMLTASALRRAESTLHNYPVDVMLTRIIGPRGRTLDGDNLQAAFKAVRDGIADALGVDDGDVMRVFWVYAKEEKGPAWAVRIRIEKRES